jgi:D-alanine-D-alanine ligase-like ATP-grasp enzyme
VERERGKRQRFDPIAVVPELLASRAVKEWVGKLSSRQWWHRRYIGVLRAIAAARWGRYTSSIDQDAINRFHRRIFEEAARGLNCEFVELPDGFLEVRFGGRVTRMRRNVLMIDHPLTLNLTRSKAVVHHLLSREGVPVPDFCQFHVNAMEPAIRFLGEAAGPCVIKPAYGSSGGAGVTTNVRSVRDLKRAAIYGSLSSDELLIEKQAPGDAYRLLYLNGELLDALRRRSPMVVGDGRSTIRQLVAAENRRRAEESGAVANALLTITPDCRATLRRGGWSLGKVPAAGVRVLVKAASNEAAASDCESVRDLIGPALIREGARAAAIVGVQLAGVDVITTNPAVSLQESGGKIIEINVTPGLHYHYQTGNPSDRVQIAEPILRYLLGITGRDPVDCVGQPEIEEEPYASASVE